VWPPYRHISMPQQARNAADMVSMVMSQ
jgi:hypothetical protein